MLTKRRLALLTVILMVLYFVLLLLLPGDIVGSRAENIMLYIPKIGFLSLSAAFTTAILLIIIFRHDIVKTQLATYNRFKYLLRLLVKRDFVSRYRKSVLGVLWSLLNPLLTMLVMTIVFSHLFRFDIEYYPVYLLSGQIIFGFFSEATMQAMGSVIAGEGIIRKVYVPKYIFPVSRVLTSLVNLFFSFLAFIGVAVFIRAPFHWTIFLIPIPIIYTFVFSLGVSLVLSSMAVFFRDLTYLYSVFITLVMYLTPIFYPVEIIPEWGLPLMGLNPLYQFVDYFRSLALRGVIPGLWPNIVCVGFSLAALCVGLYVFVTKQDKHILYL